MFPAVFQPGYCTLADPELAATSTWVICAALRIIARFMA
jgi:hypothetical protein